MKYDLPNIFLSVVLFTAKLIKDLHGVSPCLPGASPLLTLPDQGAFYFISLSGDEFIFVHVFLIAAKIVSS